MDITKLNFPTITLSDIPSLSDVEEAYKAAKAQAIASVDAVDQSLTQVKNDLVQEVQTAYDSAVATTEETLNSVSTAAQETYKDVSTTINNSYQAATTVAQKTYNDVSQAASELSDDISTTVTSSYEAVTTAAQQLAEVVQEDPLGTALQAARFLDSPIEYTLTKAAPILADQVITQLGVKDEVNDFVARAEQQGQQLLDDGMAFVKDTAVDVLKDVSKLANETLNNDTFTAWLPEGFQKGFQDLAKHYLKKIDDIIVEAEATEAKPLSLASFVLEKVGDVAGDVTNSVEAQVEGVVNKVSGEVHQENNVVASTSNFASLSDKSSDSSHGKQRTAAESYAAHFPQESVNQLSTENGDSVASNNQSAHKFSEGVNSNSQPESSQKSVVSSKIEPSSAKQTAPQENIDQRVLLVVQEEATTIQKTADVEVGEIRSQIENSSSPSHSLQNQQLATANTGETTQKSITASTVHSTNAVANSVSNSSTAGDLALSASAEVLAGEKTQHSKYQSHQAHQVATSANHVEKTRENLLEQQAAVLASEQRRMQQQQQIDRANQTLDPQAAAAYVATLTMAASQKSKDFSSDKRGAEDLKRSVSGGAERVIGKGQSQSGEGQHSGQNPHSSQKIVEMIKSIRRGVAASAVSSVKNNVENNVVPPLSASDAYVLGLG